MPIPFQPDKLLYNTYDNLPMGVGFTKVFNNTASTLLKFKALHLDTDGVQLADASLNLPAHGFAWEDIDPDEWGYMAHDTVLYQLDWFLDTDPSVQYLTQGATYYLATQGNITPVMPVTGIMQELGTAMSLHEFTIELQSLSANGAALDARITALENKMLAIDADDDDQIDMVDEQRDILTVATSGQTVFTLTRAPLQPTYAELTINGIEQPYGTAYSIVGTTLTYTSSTVSLDPTDIVIIIYR